MNFIELIGAWVLSIVFALIFVAIIHYKLPGGMKAMIERFRNPLGAIAFVAFNIVLISFAPEEYINVIKLGSMTTKDFLILINLLYLASLFIMRVFKPAQKIESVKNIWDLFYVGIGMIFVISASSIIIMDLLIAFTWLIQFAFSSLSF